MNPLRSRALAGAAVALAVLAFGCNKEKTPAAAAVAAPGPSDMDPGTVVAQIGDQKITAGEMNEKAAQELKQLEDQYQKQKYQLRRTALEQLIFERLVKEEAKKRGMSEDQYLAQAIGAKATPPTDEEVKAFYEQNKARLPPNVDFEQVKPKISEYLAHAKSDKARDEVFSQLKQEHHVKVLYKEPRKQVEAKGPSKGPDNAKVTIVEFSDFECPFCARVVPTVQQIMDTYAGKVRLVFRYYPLSFHPHAEKAAEAAACADDQGKFWEMHDVLFANQRALELEDLKKYARQVGLDSAKFDKCLDSGEKKSVVEASEKAGEAVGVSATPAFFINGLPVAGAQPFEAFKAAIDEELEQ